MNRVLTFGQAAGLCILVAGIALIAAFGGFLTGYSASQIILNLFFRAMN